jgi:predicted transcriptional regulator
MKKKRDFRIGIKSTDEFFDEALTTAGKLDAGWRPEKPVERLYFSDLRTLLKYLTPKRFELLNMLHKAGPSSINALAKTLHRQYRNVHTDVKELEMIGLVEKNEAGLYLVPWDEISAVIKLAA